MNVPVEIKEREDAIMEMYPDFVKYTLSAEGREVVFAAGDDIDVEKLVKAAMRILNITYKTLRSMPEGKRDAEYYREILQEVVSDDTFWEYAKEERNYS